MKKSKATEALRVATDIAVFRRFTHNDLRTCIVTDRDNQATGLLRCPGEKL